MNKKTNVSPDGKSPMVGVEGAWPMLFRATGVLGLVLAKPCSSGHYKTCWPRLIPMVVIVVCMAWYLFSYPSVLELSKYDSSIDFIGFCINVTLIALAFVLSVRRRRETCDLLEGLQGTQEPARAWASFASCLLAVLYALFCLVQNYTLLELELEAIAHCAMMTFISLLMPSFLDLCSMALIDALHKAYKGKVHRLERNLRAVSHCFQPWSLADFSSLQVLHIFLCEYSIDWLLVSV